MDIKVTIVKILKNEQWGFSDLLNGRELSPETLKEIKELIMEDYSEIIEEGTWDIQQCNEL